MICGWRQIYGFMDSRSGSATTKFAAGAFAIVIVSLIIGDELARLGHENVLSKLGVASNSPTFQNRGIDPAPTGAIKRPTRTPCGEKDD